MEKSEPVHHVAFVYTLPNGSEDPDKAPIIETSTRKRLRVGTERVTIYALRASYCEPLKHGQMVAYRVDRKRAEWVRAEPLVLYLLGSPCLASIPALKRLNKLVDVES